VMTNAMDAGNVQVRARCEKVTRTIGVFSFINHIIYVKLIYKNILVRGYG